MIYLYQKELILKESSKNFKEKIKEEMVVDYANALEKNYDIAKNLLRLTSAGKVDIKDKERLDEKDKILLYMIGKLYAKEAELAESEYVSNKEFANELGMNENSKACSGFPTFIITFVYGLLKFFKLCLLTLKGIKPS